MVVVSLYICLHADKWTQDKGAINIMEERYISSGRQGSTDEVPRKYFVDGNIGRLYMWEFVADPSINLWGLVQKTVAPSARKEAWQRSSPSPRSVGPPGPRTMKHK